MKKYRKTAELAKDFADMPHELARDIIYHTWIIEMNYPDDDNAFVLLLDGEQEEKDAFRTYPHLLEIMPEFIEPTSCQDKTIYTKTVYIIGQDGSGVVVFCKNAEFKIGTKRRKKSDEDDRK